MKCLETQCDFDPVKRLLNTLCIINLCGAMNEIDSAPIKCTSE